ncbi:ABC transporter substrate-binding protein [Corynebacterium hindlerae]|uniref:ABC transporter substrate-binding protein n=1 Tax=Corynebacterium hindlerae TaxID=699041 RepID=UPI001AD6A359|nr:ABC transporter substrate-binding protein [Corynebacterium hindlerae]QTH59763.1 ABC transporter substrate-binding protein [Corynebacterium hindlerae]
MLSRNRSLLSAVVALSAAVTLTACSGNATGGGAVAAAPDDAALKQRQECINTAKEQASSDLILNQDWIHVTSTNDFAELDAEVQLPAKVKDGIGAEVEVKDISKIISAGDGISATLGALGLADKIYAASEDSTSPEGICAEQHFKFGKDTGAEGLLAIDGTLFIGDNTKRHGTVAQQFRDVAMDAVVVDDQQPQLGKIKAVSEYVGATQAGEKLVADISAQLKDAYSKMAASNIAGKRVIQLTATGAGGQNSVAGKGTPGVELVTAMGLKSVGEEAGLRGFSREFSNEGLLAADPEIILIAESDLKKWGSEEGMWSAFPTLKDTTAGREQRVIVMPDAQIRYTSPELGVGAQALADALVKEFGN